MSYGKYLGKDTPIPEGELRDVYKGLAAFLNQHVDKQRDPDHKKLMDRILVQAYKSREAPSTYISPLSLPEIGPLVISPGSSASIPSLIDSGASSGEPSSFLNSRIAPVDKSNPLSRKLDSKLEQPENLTHDASIPKSSVRRHVRKATTDMVTVKKNP
jgi:hypothetical protein